MCVEAISVESGDNLTLHRARGEVTGGPAYRRLQAAGTVLAFDGRQNPPIAQRDANTSFAAMRVG